ncbi:hypothetical protein [Streptomonospora salina]|uniref:Uncharacterized protein n=1 Tax=Streptomonospora salina TaxID=104205 RepID=A0A841E6Y0_9ACTN|nr:hypothetical protein [Streptomonospora salina]MBB5998766.1 hypothetical protein [Streptomonospora salina]
MYDDRKPEPQCGAPELTPDERIVGAAYARMIPLIEGLQRNPISRHLYAEVANYLDCEAWEAADAFERLLDLGPHHLAARLDQLGPDLLTGEEDMP